MTRCVVVYLHDPLPPPFVVTHLPKDVASPKIATALALRGILRLFIC